MSASRILIVYESGRTYEVPADGRWQDAPSTGVLRVRVTRERVTRAGRQARPYTRILHGFGSYYFRVLADGSWEFGVHADLTATTTPLTPVGERIVWAPDAEEQVFDAPRLPDWATGTAVKRADGPPWPWQRGLTE